MSSCHARFSFGCSDISFIAAVQSEGHVSRLQVGVLPRVNPPSTTNVCSAIIATRNPRTTIQFHGILALRRRFSAEQADRLPPRFQLCRHAWRSPASRFSSPMPSSRALKALDPATKPPSVSAVSSGWPSRSATTAAHRVRAGARLTWIGAMGGERIASRADRELASGRGGVAPISADRRDSARSGKQTSHRQSSLGSQAGEADNRRPPGTQRSAKIRTSDGVRVTVPFVVSASLISP